MKNKIKEEGEEEGKDSEASRQKLLLRMDERPDTAFQTTGSEWLLPVSEFLGFPLDQVGSPAQRGDSSQGVMNETPAH